MVLNLNIDAAEWLSLDPPTRLVPMRVGRFDIVDSVGVRESPIR
jgi:hypothetical protein